MKKCKVKGCAGKHRAKGYCNKHYIRLSRHGDVEVVLKEQHGMEGTPEYRTWNHMKNRCNNPSVPAYKDYGGRGITICEKWNNSFTAFYEDMGPKPSTSHSIDRINNDGNYEPSNCKWATKTEQKINQRTYSNNSSGRRGVIWYKASNKWRAQITYNKKTIYLGYFTEFEEAVAAREAAELKYYGKVLN